MICWPVEAARQAGASRIALVVGHQNETVRDYFSGDGGIAFALQEEQLGTGHAVASAQHLFAGIGGRVLILCGDTPLIRPETLQGMLASHVDRQATITVLTTHLDNPCGYGRVVKREGGRILRIVEEKDATEEEKNIAEINSGIYCVETVFLFDAVARLGNDNAQGEYYLTDIVAGFARAGAVHAVLMSDDAIVGVNDRVQLCEVEERMFERIAERHRLAGCRIARGASIDDAVVLGRDVTVGKDVHLRGTTVVGDGSVIDVGCVLDATRVGANVTLLPYSVLSDSEVGEHCQLGPFTHVRPGSALEAEVKLGNFVETKATRMRRGAKANHLSYLGDGDVGENTNIGAGTIFCNYDGYAKHKTTIGRDVFIGSDSQLIAPVTIGDGAYVATASSVTEDVPADALAIGRVRQSNKAGYAPPLKARLKAAAAAAGHGAHGKKTPK
jgi:bifunctional UDP-N-acetylglucosamine pyrophosphorylase/glucosamine-1-phosphate N-acetyltransferase